MSVQYSFRREDRKEIARTLKEYPSQYLPAVGNKVKIYNRLMSVSNVYTVVNVCHTYMESPNSKPDQSQDIVEAFVIIDLEIDRDWA